jgi:hypothetical protein
LASCARRLAARQRYAAMSSLLTSIEAACAARQLDLLERMLATADRGPAPPGELAADGGGLPFGGAHHPTVVAARSLLEKMAALRAYMAELVAAFKHKDLI